MRFNLEQLRAFSLSVERGSFSAAAREMGKAQSAVSTAISNLELDLGLELFDRSRREPTLTEEGKALLPQAKALLEQAQLFEGRADSMAAGEEGRLTLAVEEALIGEALEDVLVRFERAFPQLELELLNPARRDIIRLVQEGRVDIGVLVSILEAGEGYYIKPLRQMAIVAVAGANHPLSGQTLPSFAELGNYRQLRLTSRSGQIIASEQFSSKVWKVESQYFLMDLVKRGLGWAWVLEHMARPWLDDGSMTLLRFEGRGDVAHMPVDLIISPKYKEGTAGQWLYKELAELEFLV
ncbi:LysR family transcriptional regulator [Pontibacterium sp.]|uniref:LysR family transcriptional regulator n=1 Tax=Pontibacterium sp. TaxID=2036026 RepID=UPI0035186D3E